MSFFSFAQVRVYRHWSQFAAVLSTRTMGPTLMREPEICSLKRVILRGQGGQEAGGTSCYQAFKEVAWHLMDRVWHRACLASLAWLLFCQVSGVCPVLSSMSLLFSNAVGHTDRRTGGAGLSSARFTGLSRRLSQVWRRLDETYGWMSLFWQDDELTFPALEPKLKRFRVVWSARGPAARGTFKTSCTLETNGSKLKWENALLKVIQFRPLPWLLSFLCSWYNDVSGWFLSLKHIYLFKASNLMS